VNSENWHKHKFTDTRTAAYEIIGSLVNFDKSVIRVLLFRDAR
jgi:hypothetical protein